ncbi:helix-turn-helix domain-containing protein [Magnetospirillum gryphiswaldense]|nr:helix-turn-helix transcriptional regulator [Magnetospirillum gryphiswaldense]
MNDWKTQLRLLRRYHGLKQAVIAEMLNVDQGTVSRWERGVSEPDLSRRRRLRDLMWKFGTRLECDIRRLMASPLSAKTVASTKSIILDMTFLPEENGSFDKSKIIGQDAKVIRGDSVFNELWDRQLPGVICGDFSGIHSVFFSQRTGKWTETYTIPVIIGGTMHFLSERRIIAKRDCLVSSLRVIEL